MAFDYSPMDAFNVGREIGKVNSPVSGIGDAIRNILDDARKKGLLQAQSQYQGQEALNLDAVKRTRDEATRNIPQDVTFVGATPAADRTIPTTRGGAEFIKSAPAADPFASFINSAINGENPITTPKGPVPTPEGTTDPRVQDRINTLKQQGMETGEISRFLVEKGFNPAGYNL